MNVDNYILNFRAMEQNVSRRDAIEVTMQKLFAEMDVELKAIKNKSDHKKLMEILNKYSEKWIRIANRVHVDVTLFSATVKKINTNLWMQWQYNMAIPSPHIIVDEAKNMDLPTIEQEREHEAI